MVLNAIISRILCFSIIYFTHVAGFLGEFEKVTGVTQDQSTTRSNTLIDDADDIQKQLDNEARDRFKYGQGKTIWVFHFPTQFPVLSFKEEVTRKLRNSDNFLRPNDHNIVQCNCKHQETKKHFNPPECDPPTCKHEEIKAELNPPKSNAFEKEWSYSDQHKWSATYPDCVGRSQSPVNLPVEGLVKARGARQLLFCNYDVIPTSLTMTSNGKTVTVSGEWAANKHPLVYGGAAHSRRYLFHSLTIHWPSEHTIGTLQYPMESQALHISADYGSFEEALEYSSSDPQAFLGIVNIYKFSDHTHPGLKQFLKTLVSMGSANYTIPNSPLSFFNPPFNEYVCYQGSLTTPPCTESVLWLIRGRSLPVMRETVEAAHGLFRDIDEGLRKFFIRHPQPLNDRRVFLFH